MTDRLEHMIEWNRRGGLWMKFVLVFMVWTMFGSVAVRLVDTETEKMWMVIIFSGFGLLTQLTCFGRMLYCYHRANRS